ncbi:hypothetical protein [Nocardioides mesophilus]|uniref:hypothetical protein n=1 Tax=Nocardioides mesophilus TaxID=433659 RepID=UPI001FEBCEDD|nr:hypothetical protein [Nocardioides mesophilus]
MGRDAAPEHVHVITVPRPGAPRDLLWERFAGVFGIDPRRYAPTGERANPSLGVPETALLRRVNQQVNNGVLANDDYRRFVRELLAHRTLSQRSESPRLALPPQTRSWAADLSESWIGLLGERGYDVVGDLAELRPEPAAGTAFVDPDHPDETQVADAATEAIVVLLQEAARLAGVERSLREDVHAAHRDLDRTRGLWFRAKRRLVHLADDNRAAAAGLTAYRRVRARSSRSA